MTHGLMRCLTMNEEIFNHMPRKVGAEVKKRIEALKIGQKMQDLPQELWHESFHRYYFDPERKGGPNLRMIRLDPKKPSLTVTGYIFNKFVHPYEDRFITVREAARLQGFPDTVKFHGSLTSTQQQVGNAVPVDLAKAVFSSVIKILAEHVDQDLNAISLFSGAGGMDLGAEQAHYKELKINTVLCLEIWDDACKTLKTAVKPSTKICNHDISQIDTPNKFVSQILGSPLLPDLIYGGPPCQAFSQAGKQKGTKDDRGNLVFNFMSFIEAFLPKAFVMENVSNLKSIEKGSLLKKLIIDAENMGYNVEWGILNSADFGSAQIRKRLFLIGVKKEIGKPLLPLPTYSDQPDLILQPYNTVGNAFNGLPVVIPLES